MITFRETMNRMNVFHNFKFDYLNFYFIHYFYSRNRSHEDKFSDFCSFEIDSRIDKGLDFYLRFPIEQI